jgi:hypothetical protein
MKNHIERLLQDYRDFLNPYHLFSVSNLEIEEKHRRIAILPGHLAEGFIFNKNYQVEYIGANSKSSPTLRAELERKAIESSEKDLEQVKLELKNPNLPEGNSEAGNSSKASIETIEPMTVQAPSPSEDYREFKKQSYPASKSPEYQQNKASNNHKQGNTY